MALNPISDADITLIVAAIDFFIPDKIPEYTSEKKHEINSYARRIKKKLLNYDTDITTNEIHSVCICLNYLRNIILSNNFHNDLDIKFKNDSDKYLSQIDDLIDQFASHLLAFGIDIFS